MFTKNNHRTLIWAIFVLIIIEVGEFRVRYRQNPISDANFWLYIKSRLM